MVYGQGDLPSCGHARRAGSRAPQRARSQPGGACSKERHPLDFPSAKSSADSATWEPPQPAQARRGPGGRIRASSSGDCAAGGAFEQVTAPARPLHDLGRTRHRITTVYAAYRYETCSHQARLLGRRRRHGELREGGPRARVCRRRRNCTAAAMRSILVTSGAIARGMRTMGLPQRPSAIGELQAASAVGQGKLYRVYDELLRERGVTSAQVLLTFFDMSARTHYLNARQTLATLLELASAAGDQRERHHRHRRDLLRRQRLPRRPGRSADRRRRADPADRHRRPLHGRPAPTPRARLDEGRDRVRGPRGARHRPHDLAAGLGRDALQGRRRRHGHRGGDRLRRSATDWMPRRSVRCSPVGAPGTRFQGARGALLLFKLWLKYAKPSLGRLPRSSPGAARAVRETSASLLPVGVIDVQGDFDAGDAVDNHRTRSVRRWVAEGPSEGICNYSAPNCFRSKGRKPAAVREPLPRATDEAVHRD